MYTYIRFYFSRSNFCIAAWNLYNINFPAPDTLQVVVPNDHHMQEHMLVGQEYYVLLDEGAVTGPGPCYLPSAAVDDPHFYRAFYGQLPSEYVINSDG